MAPDTGDLTVSIEIRADAQSWLAITLTARVLDQMSVSTTADIARAEGLVHQVSEAAPRSPLAHSAKGQLLRVQKRYAEAIAEYGWG